jgi:SAM-dependent methyltransferase
MCGTGRFLIPLIAEGFDIRGFDASEHMLSALHAKAKFRGLKPNVWQGFVEELKKPERYNLIFIPSGSFGLIIDLEETLAALKTFYDHLSDDGILVFEAETLKAKLKQSDIWRASVWLREDGKMIIANFLDLPLSDDIMTSIAKYELIDNNHIIQTEIETYKIRLYDPEQLTQMLTDVGFSNVRTIKAFDKYGIPDENDESIVYECTK